jgi:hypothetical protein
MESMPPQDRARRDEAAVAEYRRLRDAGDRRRLVRAETGDLVLYRPEEIGARRGGAGYTVRTLGGLRALGVGLGVLAAAAVVGLVVAVASGASGGWALLVPAALTGAGGAWAFTLAGREQRAAALRRERGLPEPARHPY